MNKFAVALVLALAITTSFGGKTRQDPDLDVTYLQSFREYTLSLLRQSYFVDAFEQIGAVSYCSFTLGHLLAVINEKVLNVPTVGIPKVLKLKSEHVPVAYAELLEGFIEDSDVSPSSTFYTPNTQYKVTPQYSKLHTVREILSLYQNVQASFRINENINVSTQGGIDNLVVPQVPPFNKNVVGVYTNTFHYKSNWVTPFTQIGEKPFQASPLEKICYVQTLETTGSFPVTIQEGYNAVAVPLVGDRKHVVFVQPKGNVQDFIQRHISEIFSTSPQKWQKQVVRLQVPQVNLTLARNFVSQLNAIAESATQCKYSADDVASENYLHPIVQVMSSKFTPEAYELSVANGVQVDKYDAHFAVKSDDDEVIPTTNVKTRETDPAAVPPPIGSNTEFFINRPYFVYVHDSKLGAVSFTAVRTPFVDEVQENKDPRHHHGPKRVARHVPNHLQFAEVSKVNRWNCGHDHRDQTCKTQ